MCDPRCRCGIWLEWAHFFITRPTLACGTHCESCRRYWPLTTRCSNQRAPYRSLLWKRAVRHEPCTLPRTSFFSKLLVESPIVNSLRISCTAISTATLFWRLTCRKDACRGICRVLMPRAEDIPVRWMPHAVHPVGES